MTREEFIAKFRHEIDGWVLEGCMENRRGEALSMWLRKMRAEIEVKLGTMFDALILPPTKPPSNNGTHTPPTRKVTP